MTQAPEVKDAKTVPAPYEATEPAIDPEELEQPSTDKEGIEMENLLI